MYAFLTSGFSPRGSCGRVWSARPSQQRSAQPVTAGNALLRSTSTVWIVSDKYNSQHLVVACRVANFDGMVRLPGCRQGTWVCKSDDIEQVGIPTLARMGSIGDRVAVNVALNVAERC